MGAGCGAVAGMKGGEFLPEVHTERGADTPASKVLTCGEDAGSSQVAIGVYRKESGRWTLGYRQKSGLWRRAWLSRFHH